MPEAALTNVTGPDRQQVWLPPPPHGSSSAQEGSGHTDQGF
jgi:hypothetical protein